MVPGRPASGLPPAAGPALPRGNAHRHSGGRWRGDGGVMVGGKEGWMDGLSYQG